MICDRPCPIEMLPQHAVSAGKVDDDELIYRSAFDDTIEKTASKLKKKAIRDKELIAHETLSFWRSLSGSDGEISAAEQKLKDTTPSNKKLWGHVAITAREIRDLRDAEDRRLFCVIDDCRTDYQGGVDRLHCGIRLCSRIQPADDPNDPEYIYAKDHLYELLSRNVTRSA